MARDRLTALRIQQTNNSDRWSCPSQTAVDLSQPLIPPRNVYVQPDRQHHMLETRWSHPAQGGMSAPYLERLPSLPNPYVWNTGQTYTNSSLRNSTIPEYSETDGGMSAFYSEIGLIQDDLRTFNDSVSRISDLHARSLDSIDWVSARRSAHQLDGLVKETSALSDKLKVRIQNLHTKDADGRDGEIRKQQTGLVKHKFVQAIQNYQQVEQTYRLKYKQRMERQFRVVKPDATSEEVKAVVDDAPGGQVFAQLLQSSSRYGASRAAFREVQERNEDVKRIEQTLSELAQLFNDMHILVMKDSEAVDGIHAMATDIEKHAEVGLRYTEKAISSARASRKRKWICIAIVFIILALFGMAVGILAAELNNGNNI
ncbi:t-SNARE [Ramaria rubella]|nr:t-SNARE [Ramaria rubella]